MLDETDLLIVDVPGEVCRRPGPGHAAVETEAVPHLVSPPAAGDERTSRSGGLNHHQVRVLGVRGEDRGRPADLTAKPPRGLSADGDQRHPGLGGAGQVHGDPGYGVHGLRLRLVEDKTKSGTVHCTVLSSITVGPVELLAIFIPSDAVEFVLVRVATLQHSPGSPHQISGHLNTLNHGRAHSHRR